MGAEGMMNPVLWISRAALLLLSLGFVGVPPRPTQVEANGPLRLAGKPWITPTHLVPGQEAIIGVPVRSGEATKRVRLQIKLGSLVIGENVAGPLGANEARSHMVKITVPTTAAPSLTLTIWGEGIQLGHLTAPTRTRYPAEKLPLLPTAVRCGPTTCAIGQVCCNSSCGVCTPPDGACLYVVCNQ